MTSNLGTEALSRQRVGFTSGEKESALAQRSEKAFSALKGHFPPEFLNRIDDMVLFNDLTKDDLLSIVDLLLAEMKSQMPVPLSLSDNARKFIVDHGRDKDMGARPLRRAITRYIENPMADLMIAGALVGISSVSIEVNATASKLIITPTPALTLVP
jgi:ATP-dependent Clp protease ATP-binding subunit ClpC